jgi:hypothetical protein
MTPLRAYRRSARLAFGNALRLLFDHPLGDYGQMAAFAIHEVGVLG